MASFFAIRQTLVDGVELAFRRDPNTTVPNNLGQWILDQLLRVPNLDRLDTMGPWHLRRIIQRTGRVPLNWLVRAVERRIDLEEKEGFEALGIGKEARLSQFVEPIEQLDASTEDLVSRLVNMSVDKGRVMFFAPKILRDIDPTGLVVPGVVADQLSKMETGDAWRLARLAQAYPINQDPWRRLAKPFLARAAKESRDPPYFWSDLAEHGVTSWTGVRGEVPAVFRASVEKAEERLESETEKLFRPFWRWHLRIAEEQLAREEQRAKEERGE